MLLTVLILDIYTISVMLKVIFTKFFFIQKQIIS